MSRTAGAGTARFPAKPTEFRTRAEIAKAVAAPTPAPTPSPETLNLVAKRRTANAAGSASANNIALGVSSGTYQRQKLGV